MTTSKDASKRQRLRAPERRRQILEAARQAYASRGLAATGKDIAAVAGINEALIYRHFESKEELLAAAAIETLDELARDTVARGYEHPRYEAGGIDDIRRFYSRLLALLVDAIPILGVVLFSEQGPRFYRSRIAPALDTLSAGVEELDLSDWNLRDFPPQLLINLIFGMCLGVALDGRFRGIDVDIQGTAAEMTTLLFEGLRSRPEQPVGPGTEGPTSRRSPARSAKARRSRT